jgi:hypothetical protein
MSEFDDVGNPIANPWERMTFREAAIDGRCPRCGGAQWEAKRSAKNKALGYAALGVGGALAASKDLVECVTCGLRLGLGTLEASHRRQGHQPPRPGLRSGNRFRRLDDGSPVEIFDARSSTKRWLSKLKSRSRSDGPYARRPTCRSTPA